MRCPGKRRSRSGKGQRIEVNLLSSLLSSLPNQASAYLATARSPERMGNQHPSVAPYETLRCKDGYLAVCCGNDTQFRRLAAVLEIPFLAEDSRFVTNAARVAHRAELVAAMEEMLRRDTTDVWAARLTDGRGNRHGWLGNRLGDLTRPGPDSHSVTSRARRFGIRSRTRQRP